MRVESSDDIKIIEKHFYLEKGNQKCLHLYFQNMKILLKTIKTKNEFAAGTFVTVYFINVKKLCGLQIEMRKDIY